MVDGRGEGTMSRRCLICRFFIACLIYVIHQGSMRVFGLSAPSTRSTFLSSSVASIVLGGSFGTCVLAQEECQAKEESGNTVPRYIDKELEMQYAENARKSPITSKVLVRRITGDSSPYQFPIREIQLTKVWPKDPPFERKDFFRTDNNDDTWFYTVPRLVYHIDEPAVAALTQFYRRTIPKGSKILDVCSSWTSHYPIEFPKTMQKICATGISERELQFNDQITPPGCYVAQDLNVNPVLPYDDAAFDVVTCVVSIDYLIHPIEVLKEINRVLKPGGQVLISQSNRCFPTKAIALWLKLQSDQDHLELINGYFQYAGGFLPRRHAYDITPIVPQDDEKSRYHDPMFVIQSIKG